MTRKTFPLLFIFGSLIVSACASAPPKAPIVNTEKNATTNSARPTLESEAIDKAMQTALANAEASDNTKEIIATLAQIHSRNPNDAIIATRYARALRESDQINKAQGILRPFVNGETPNVEAVTEMAMTQLSLGNYETAKEHALKATAIDPKNARGYLALGTAQDALNDHENAEISFRQGLKNWKGDPSPILNNLALNLASQGHLEESLSLLERAVKISPKRMELERNRRIIATLLETSGTPAPAPYRKPDIIIPETAKPHKPKPKPVIEPTASVTDSNNVTVTSTIENEINKAANNIVGVTTNTTKQKAKTNIKLKSVY